MHPALLERAADLPSAGARRLLRAGPHGGDGAAARPAVLGRVAQTQEAELAEAFEDGVRERLFLPLLEVRLHLGGEELPDVEPQLFVGVREVHRVEFRPERPGACLRYDSPPWIPFGN